MTEEQPRAAQSKQLLLQRVYIKDLSFESPKAPGIFMSTVAPASHLNIRSNAQLLAPNVHEVTLTLTVEAKDKDTTLFLVELAQAGIFSIQGYTPEEEAALIGSFCPGTLYPFAREAIAAVVGKGGFPPLLLQPINFDALYAHALKDRAERNGASATAQRGGADAH